LKSSESGAKANVLVGKDRVGHSVGLRTIRPMLGERHRGGA